LAHYDVQKLITIFGKTLGVYFNNAANAIDNEPVQEQGEAGSIGRIGTLKQDSRDLTFILHKADELIEHIFKEVAEKNLSYKQVVIYVVLTDLNSKSRSVTLEQPSKDKETIKRYTRNLFEKFMDESTLEVRRVGVKVSGFSKEETQQKTTNKFFPNRLTSQITIFTHQVHLLYLISHSHNINEEHHLNFTEAKLGRIFILRLHHNECLHDVIEDFAIKQRVTSALCFFLGGVKENSKIIVGPKDGQTLPLNQ
jgi:hypothetical protein